MSASSVYLCICFVFLYVCRFFIAFDFAFFSQYFVTKEPKPCLKYFTVSNDKCTPGHLSERALNTKGLELDSFISGGLAGWWQLWKAKVRESQSGGKI